MKFLLDANLSDHLVKKLAEIYADCQHVTRTGFPMPAEDIAIWQWAKANDRIIVTNDDDYYHLANLYGFPPKVVLLRIGNQSTQAMAETLIKHYEALKNPSDSSDTGLLELF